MSLTESVRNGFLTIRELSDAITCNLNLAEKLNITMRTYFNKNKIYTGELRRDGKVIFKKLYTDQFQHMRIARFHGDANEIMVKIERDENVARYHADKKARQAQEEAARIAEIEERRKMENLKWVPGFGFVQKDS